MGNVFTCGEWVVKPGHEEEFVSEWDALAQWTAREVEGAGWGTLVQDRERPNVFLSFGPWTDDAAIEAWRSRPEFQERVAAIGKLLETFTPGTYDERAHAKP